MKELSLHLLDIAQNSIAAGARHVDLTVEEAGDRITLTVADDGCGMSPEFLAQVTDPFTTTRTTRKVGLGLPLLRLAAEQTGGALEVESREGVGTTVTAVFHAGHIDCPPLGDMAATVALLAQGLPAFDAALCGVWLHGAAADLCARRTSQMTMLPHDILQDLGELLGARGL